MFRLALVVLVSCVATAWAAADSVDELIQAIKEGDNARVKNLLKRNGELNRGGPALSITPLMAAAEKGNVEIMQLMIAKGADVNFRTKDGATALFYAAKFRQKAPVQLLLQHGADINVVLESDGSTPIMAAASKLNSDVITELATHGAKVNAQTKSGNTALLVALSFKYDEPQARQFRMDTVLALLKSGANVNQRNAAGRSALYLAVTASPGGVELIKVILDAGADLNAPTTEGRTALMLAAEEGMLDSATFLVERGANLHARDQAGMTAMMIAELSKQQHASRERFDKLAGLFRSKGLTISPDDLRAIARAEAGERLESALQSQNLDAVKLALKEGADPKSIFHGNYESMRVPVVAAPAAAGNLEMVDFLLGAGANPNATSADGTSVVMWAAMAGQTRIVERLLGHGAAVNARNGEGSSALLEAAFWGRTNTVKLLLAKGADPNVRGKSGITPLMWAAYNGYHEIVALLIQSGADPNAKDDEGRTALARTRSSAFMSQLLETGPITFVVAEQAARDGAIVVKKLISVGAK